MMTTDDLLIASLIRYAIAKGLEHRSRGVHQMNLDSSRSHAIFSVYIDALDDDDGTGRPAAARYGKISLLDLAGSENVRSTQSHGTGLKEAGSINKSLFALGQVIKALALEARNGPESRQPSGLARVPAHVPYRDSTLTKLLADSLGGSAHTLMIACCSPFLAYADESIRTLHYACSAGAIRNKPVVKLDPQEQLILRLRDEVATFKAKVAQLQGELERSNTRLIAHGLPTVAATPATAGGAGGERPHSIHSSGGERPRPPSAPPSACYSPDSARRGHGNGSVSIASFGNGYEDGHEGGREWAQWAPVPAPATAQSVPRAHDGVALGATGRGRWEAISRQSEAIDETHLPIALGATGRVGGSGVGAHDGVALGATGRVGGSGVGGSDGCEAGGDWSGDHGVGGRSSDGGGGGGGSMSGGGDGAPSSAHSSALFADTDTIERARRSEALLQKQRRIMLELTSRCCDATILLIACDDLMIATLIRCCERDATILLIACDDLMIASLIRCCDATRRSS